MKYLCKRCNHQWNPRFKKEPVICPRCKSPYWNKTPKITKEFVNNFNQMVLKVHNVIIQKSGGEFGIRDDGSLYNAIYKILRFRFNNNKNPSKVGAYIFHDVARRHYFVDGNKRTSYILTKIILLSMNYHLKLNYKDSVKVILKIARHKNPLSKDEIEIWLKKHTIKIPSKEIDKYLKEVYYDIHHKEKKNE